MRLFYFFQLIYLCLAAHLSLKSPYGEIEIEDPFIEALIDSEDFQRLKQIHQYGIYFQAASCEAYSRFDHSVGVYALLKKAGVEYEEQVSGLLHDASHTAFSHFADYLFKVHGEDAWQDLNHQSYLEATNLGALIKDKGFVLDKIYHKNKHFIALDSPLPYLCADRLEYNLSGAYKRNLITLEEVQNLYKDAQFEKGTWSLSKLDLAEKLAKSSITMMEEIWSCPISHVSNLILCSVVNYALTEQILKLEDLRFNTDLFVLEKLQKSQEAYIQKGLKAIFELPKLLISGDRFNVPYKCRAINPHIRMDGRLVPLTEASNYYNDAFNQARNKARVGFSFDFKEGVYEALKEYLIDLE